MTASGDPATLVGRLIGRGWTIGVAESLTGGQVAAALIDVPGASAVVRGGIVAYATDLKRSLVGVDGTLLDERGPVDVEVARQLADRVRVAVAGDLGPADVGLATTGVAGPGPAGTIAAGTVHVAVATPDGVWDRSLRLAGDRADVRRDATAAAIALACEHV